MCTEREVTAVKAAQKEREMPGVMLYMNRLEMLDALPGSSVKTLVLGILDYAATGREPELRRSAERVAWATLRKDVDRDRAAYAKKCEDNQYHTFLREAQKRMPRSDCPSREDWLRLSQGGARKPTAILDALSGDIGR